MHFSFLHSWWHIGLWVSALFFAKRYSLQWRLCLHSLLPTPQNNCILLTVLQLQEKLLAISKAEPNVSENPKRTELWQSGNPNRTEPFFTNLTRTRTESTPNNEDSFPFLVILFAWKKTVEANSKKYEYNEKIYNIKIDCNLCWWSVHLSRFYWYTV